MKRLITCAQCGLRDAYGWDVLGERWLEGVCRGCGTPLEGGMPVRQRPSVPDIQATVARLEALDDPLASAWAWMGRQILKRRARAR